VDIRDFLFQKFLEWQKKSGQRRSIKDWARELGVPQTSLSNWMNGPYLPKGASLGKLAAHLGPEIYDVLNMTRPASPDPKLQAMINGWRSLSEEDKQTLYQDFLVFQARAKDK
jgi:hypothetical protein